MKKTLLKINPVLTIFFIFCAFSCNVHKSEANPNNKINTEITAEVSTEEESPENNDEIDLLKLTEDDFLYVESHEDSADSVENVKEQQPPDSLKLIPLGALDHVKLTATKIVTKVWRLILSIPALGKANFVAKMQKNVSKVGKGSFSAFDEVKLVHGGKGRLYLGMMPDADILKSLATKAQQGDAKSEVAVLSAVEDFELMGYKIAKRDGTVYQTVDKGALMEIAGNNFKQIVVKDYGAVPLKELDEGATFIAEQLKNERALYVHCKSGKGRSASLVMAYLMKYERLSFDDALKFLKTNRPDISLMPTQLESLRLYSKNL